MKRKARAHTGPHIRVGSDFQAELPELQTTAASEEEEHASLVWKPLEEDDSDMGKPDRVRQLLDMASARGVSGPAANLELALHCLHQARGSLPVRSGSLGAQKSGQGIPKAWALG
ncbi:zinc finger protein 541-like [Cyanistes caeruleus]|uniref:zinc finger protein 541-like n=1 Tax=Cyanistes caeruleus TaxID=156563 RepID=UPI000CDA92BA|nr:zinc finger protein 541-like [Cyanistes caeruleus]